MLQIPIQKLKDFLVNEGLITAGNFDDLSKEALRMGQNINDILISRGIMTVEYFYNLLARHLNVEKSNLVNRKINEEVLKLLPENIAVQKKVIIFDKEANGVLDAAMEDPSDLVIVEFLKKNLNANIKTFLATPEDLNKGFAMYGRRFAEDFQKVFEENITASLRQKAKTIEEAASVVPIVSLIDNIIFYAISIRASDIHIEILDDAVLIRFRIDGVLHEVIRIPKEIHQAIIARIKLLAGLKIDEHQKPQDGRSSYKTGSGLVDVRVSTMPTYFGEKIEIRLLPATQKPLSLREVGLMEDMVVIVEENIKKIYGMILVTGPTGSGKTTTLYAILNILNKPEINIITVEDPIEYNMKYINQVQINPAAGITFADGLRSILRQDPNVIMVGEIRDEETAEIAIHSALTGHLLVSSLHTNDAPTAILRFIDMHIAPFLVSAVLNMVIAQRLVRKICLNCIESFTPPAEIVSSIKKQLEEIHLSVDFKGPKILYRGRGCLSCNNTGYSGRLGIFEILNIDEEIRREIINPNFDFGNLRKIMQKKGMISMFEDGLRKAELGITSIEEVLRAIRE
ncbi:type II/IV secretion system protein [Candidatus Wolfebacteria bacterium]|nr:type II/IV secretion system protein [Candidatus Wolfebacteria bacterium]